MTNSSRDLLWGVSIMVGTMLALCLSAPWLVYLFDWYFSIVQGVMK